MNITGDKDGPIKCHRVPEILSGDTVFYFPPLFAKSSHNKMLPKC